MNIMKRELEEIAEIVGAPVLEDSKFITEKNITDALVAGGFLAIRTVQAHYDQSAQEYTIVKQHPELVLRVEASAGSPYRYSPGRLVVGGHIMFQ